MSLILPSAVPSMGTRRVLVLPTVGNINAITKTEADAAVNISCYLTRSGGWAATKDQASISDGRFCSSQDFEVPGMKTRQLSLQYVFNLEEPDEDEARLTLAEGDKVVLAHFLQIPDGEDEFAVGNWYEAVPVTLGEQNIVQVEDNAVDRINQKAFIRGEWTPLRQLVTGS